MTNKIVTRITVVSFIVGVMIAVQYNTVQNPTTRDTRDIWAIRQELSEEKENHSQLLKEIASYNEFIKQYEDDDAESQAVLLNNTVDDLKRQIGLLSVSGPGLVLEITPATELIQFGYEIEPISADLLIRLVNEIYRYDGLYIEIDGQRLTHTSAIRDINGVTNVNSVPIDETNIDIKIITETFEKAEKLYGYLFASPFRDDFYLDNLNLNINEAQENITISEFDGQLSTDFLVEDNEGE
ncbi:DUF881 domain-containing protein [Lysinibacillus sp. SGAir0095]|uniref:DUF881 domain-containing protein n=1 Tax=Lysinibacillus sp. SGAir0095 TaxID=2070463 RepID=UPI0010CCB30C|nr:DUF881 domain-containing protein [Lysinibacillus sp. SGAir0095]QCR31712.1 hypothetical protein C1N55_05800 [Lysinibacillus sp. SGAir0095]